MCDFYASSTRTGREQRLSRVLSGGHGNRPHTEDVAGPAEIVSRASRGAGARETTPAVLQLGVVGAVGILVAVVLAVSFVLWLLLR
jgi:hypothetical protein